MQVASFNKRKLMAVIGKCIPVAGIVWLCTYIGEDLAASGEVRARILLVFVAFFAVWVRGLPDKKKFRLLLWAIVLVPLQHWTRFGVQLSGLILFLIAFFKLPILQLGRGASFGSSVRWRGFIPYIIFALAGLVSCRRNGELYIWQLVCLTPLAWMYVSTRMVNGANDAFVMVRVALLSIVGCVVYVWFANALGFASTASEEQFRTVAESIRIGPFYFQVTPLRFGTMAALVIPSTGLLLTKVGVKGKSKFFYACCLLLFFGIVMKTAARGAAIAGVAGLALVVFYRVKTTGWRAVLPLVIMALSAIGFGTAVGDIVLPVENRLDFIEMLQGRTGLLGIPNFRHRYELLMLAYDNTRENPLGLGFNYFWKNFRYDECVSYSSLLNGTGFIGFVAYFSMIGQLVFSFARSLREKVSREQRELAVLGIATISVALLAAIASESVVWHSVNTFVLWAILSACYAGTCNVKRRSAQTNKNLNSPNRLPAGM